MPDTSPTIYPPNDPRRRALEDLLAAMERQPVAPPIEGATPRGVDAQIMRELVDAVIAGRVAAFLTREQILRLVDDRLAQIGLRMDEDHVEETGEAVRGAMKWHRLLSKTWMAAIGTVLLGVLYALARKAGLPVPTSP